MFASKTPLIRLDYLTGTRRCYGCFSNEHVSHSDLCPHPQRRCKDCAVIHHTSVACKSQSSPNRSPGQGTHESRVETTLRPPTSSGYSTEHDISDEKPLTEHTLDWPKLKIMYDRLSVEVEQTLQYFQRLPTTPPPQAAKARMNAEFRHLQQCMDILRNISLKMNKLPLDQEFPEERRHQQTCLNQTMERLHDAVMHIKSTHEGILSVTTSMSEGQKKDATSPFPPCVEQVESSHTNQARQEKVVEPSKLIPDERKHCPSCKYTCERIYSRRDPSIVNSVQCKNKKCNEYQPSVHDAKGNLTEVEDRVECLVDGKPHSGKVKEIVVTNDPRGDPAIALVKFAKPIKINGEFLIEGEIPVCLLTNVEYPPQEK